jgi:hypothetical protein
VLRCIRPAETLSPQPRDHGTFLFTSFWVTLCESLRSARLQGIQHIAHVSNLAPYSRFHNLGMDPDDESTDLEGKLLSIGLETYLSMLLSNGYRTWDSVLGLSEVDLDALKFKRGHRRRLQRYIATERGHSTDDPLSSAPNSRNHNHSAPPLIDDWNAIGERHPSDNQSSIADSILQSSAQGSGAVGSSTRMVGRPFAETTRGVSQTWPAVDHDHGESNSQRCNDGWRAVHSHQARQYSESHCDGHGNSTPSFQDQTSVQTPSAPFSPTVQDHSHNEGNQGTPDIFEFINF